MQKSMRTGLYRAVAVVCLAAVVGCAEVPPESVTASEQLGKNLEILRENNLRVLDEWYNLSVDYWTEKVGREGPDKILQKARADGITFNPDEDYRDLVEQVLKQYRAQFLGPLDAAYRSYRDSINADYALTMNGNARLTALLRSVVKVDAERAALLGSIATELKVKDDLGRIRDKLEKIAK